MFKWCIIIYSFFSQQFIQPPCQLSAHGVQFNIQFWADYSAHSTSHAQVFFCAFCQVSEFWKSILNSTAVDIHVPIFNHHQMCFHYTVLFTRTIVEHASTCWHRNAFLSKCCSKAAKIRRSKIGVPKAFSNFKSVSPNPTSKFENRIWKPYRC